MAARGPTSSKQGNRTPALRAREQSHVKKRRRPPKRVLSNWIVVKTEPRRENWARINIERQQLNTFLPRIEIKHKAKLEPLFPGYLFVECPDGRLPLRGTWGMTGYVPTNERIEYVPIKVMKALRALTNKEGFIPLPTPKPLKRGGGIKFVRGSFKDLLGVYIRDKPNRRVLVLLKLLGQNVEFEVDRRDVEAFDLQEPEGQPKDRAPAVASPKSKSKNRNRP